MHNFLASAPTALLFAFATLAHAAPPPVAAYAALPEASLVRLSPDGKHLAYASDVKGHEALVIADLQGESKPKVMPVAPFDLSDLQWKDGESLVVSLRNFELDGGVPVAKTRLVVVKRDGSAMRDLAETNKAGDLPQVQSNLVNLLPKDPKHLWIALPHFERATGATATQAVAYGGYLSDNDLKYPEVVEVDIDTGRSRVVQPQRFGVVGWGSDEAGRLRLSYTLAVNGKNKVKGVDHKDEANADWKTLSTSPADSSDHFEPLAFSATDPDTLYVLSDSQGSGQAGHLGIFAFSLSQAAFVKPIAYRESQDVTPLVVGKRLVGYRFGTEPDVYIDPAWRKDFQAISAAMPDTPLHLIDRSEDGKRILFRTQQGSQPNTYWLLDRRSGQTEARELITLYADVPTESIAPTRAIRYKARDGADIPALLTLPIGAGQNGRARQDAPIPFVVLPHGGPTEHDRTGFNPWVQLLASRGYGVLQPQFRGSTGYGLAHQLAGRQQWGLRMQDDVTDGTQWLIQQKLADANRICIVGASYGGYAALEGLVKEPGLYKCAVAFAPVTDLVDLSDESASFIFGEFTKDELGHDSAQLAATSPARHGERVQAPLLLIHGRKDYVVPVSHTQKLSAAWTKAGKQVETIYLEEGDHFLSRPADRLTTFQAIERFLAAQLNPPATGQSTASK